jgi:hypothetical protein
VPRDGQALSKNPQQVRASSLPTQGRVLGSANEPGSAVRAACQSDSCGVLTQDGNRYNIGVLAVGNASYSSSNTATNRSGNQEYFWRQNMVYPLCS